MDDLEEWISQQMDQGFSERKIRSHLRDEGFASSNIDQAFRNIKERRKPRQTTGKDNYNKSKQEESLNHDKSKENVQNGEKKDEKESIVQDFTIENSFRTGLSFFRSSSAKKSFLYLFSAWFLIDVLSRGLEITEQSGPILGIVGSVPLSIGLLFGSVLLGVVYVKFFRIILSEVNVDLQPMSNLGSILALLRIGVGYILYAIFVLIGLVFFIFPGIIFAQRLFFFNYGVMQGHGLIHSFKKSWKISEGHIAKMIGLSFSTTFLSFFLSLPFETSAQLLDSLGYSNLSVLIGIPGAVISSMATIAVLGAAYDILIAEQNSANTM